MGRLSTHILDTSAGQPAGGVRIVLRRDDQVLADTRTNADGYYSAPYLPPGEYEVAVENSGFKKASVTGINLTSIVIATIWFFRANGIAVLATIVSVFTLREFYALLRGCGQARA